MKETYQNKIFRKIQSGKTVCGSIATGSDLEGRIGITVCLSLVNNTYMLQIEKYHLNYGALEESIKEETKLFSNLDEVITYITSNLNIDINIIR